MPIEQAKLLVLQAYRSETIGAIRLAQVTVQKITAVRTDIAAEKAVSAHAGVRFIVQLARTQPAVLVAVHRQLIVPQVEHVTAVFKFAAVEAVKGVPAFKQIIAERIFTVDCPAVAPRCPRAECFIGSAQRFEVRARRKDGGASFVILRLRHLLI